MNGIVKTLIILILLVSMALFYWICVPETTETAKKIDGELLFIKSSYGLLFFSFQDRDGQVLDNIRKKIKYSISIDNGLKEPKLVYIQKTKIIKKPFEDTKKEKLPIKEVEISLNKEMYKKLTEENMDIPD